MMALISPAYLAEQKLLHAAPRGYGGKGDKWADAVEGMVKRFGARSVLDYGCGRGSLMRELRARLVKADLREYDPAIAGKDGKPDPADIVVCTDVLEHIEPDCLNSVIGHMFALSIKALFLVVATRPAGKTLSDGRNAHLIVETQAWWEKRLSQTCYGFEYEPGPPRPGSDKQSREVSMLFVRP